MERNLDNHDDLIDLGSIADETKGIVGLSQDLDQSPKGGAGILDD
jgi:hypothetical protein